VGRSRVALLLAFLWISSGMNPKEPWFKIRERLNVRRATFLTACSFLLPLALWCLVSYVPFIWHPDVRLEISADRADVSTVYIAGDHVSKEFFGTFQDAVRNENATILQPREPGNQSGGLMARRDNQKKLRQLAPLAIANGWLRSNQREDDSAIFEIWKAIATGRLASKTPPLSAENLAIVRQNWQTLSAESQTFDIRKLPEQPLLNLIPQGHPSNPSYLPAPHEVLLTGWHIFTNGDSLGQLSLFDRLLISVRIVWGGFLLSCLVGVPIGVVAGTYSVFSKLLEPFTDFFRYMPAPAFSTLLVAAFGADDSPKIALVFIGTFFQMVLVISKTTRQLDHSLLEAAQTLGARPRQLFTHVVIPGILPDLYNDLRILLGWSWTWLVIAELIGVKTGLTEFIETQGRWRNFDAVFPVIILIGLIGFFTDQFLAWFRGVLFPYTRTTRANSKMSKRPRPPAKIQQTAVSPKPPVTELTPT
jgi:NitT/TauT family transport system permease protein